MAASRRALIIGGSLGGLMSACLLRRDGWQVDIFERVEDPLSGRGAGIVTHPQLLAALAQCGAKIDDSIGVAVSTRLTLDASGREIGRLTMPQIMTSWGRLFAMLRAEFPDDRYHRGLGLTQVENFADRRACPLRRTARRCKPSFWSAPMAFARRYARSLCLRWHRSTPAMSRGAAWSRRAHCPRQRTRSCSTSSHSACRQASRCWAIRWPGPATARSAGHRRYNLVWYRPAAEESDLVDLLTDESGHRHEISIPPPLIRREVVARMRHDADALLAPQFAEMVRLTPQPFFQPIYDVESPQLVFGRVALDGRCRLRRASHVGMGVTKAAGDAVALADALRGTDDVVASAAAGTRPRACASVPQ